MANVTKNTNRTVIKIIVSALAIVFVMLVVALIVNLVKLGAVNSRKEALAEQNAKLDAMLEQNEQMLDACNNSEFVEQYAREYLDMVYRNEIVIEKK